MINAQRVAYLVLKTKNIRVNKVFSLCDKYNTNYRDVMKLVQDNFRGIK